MIHIFVRRLLSCIWIQTRRVTRPYSKQTDSFLKNKHLVAASLTIWIWDGDKSTENPLQSLSRPSLQMIKTAKCRLPKRLLWQSIHHVIRLNSFVTLAVSAAEVTWNISHNPLVLLCVWLPENKDTLENNSFLPIFIIKLLKTQQKNQVMFLESTLTSLTVLAN